MHYLRRQCVIQWPTIEHTIFNSNYPPPISRERDKDGEHERERQRERERERYFIWRWRGSFLLYSAANLPSPPPPDHPHLMISRQYLRCIGVWVVAALLRFLLFPLCGSIRDVCHAHTHTHTHTHTEQITQPFMSQHSCSLLAGSTLRASHTSSLELATSAYEWPPSLPPNMARKVRLAGAAAANLSGSTSI